jgi:hypothetical protein
MRTLQRLVRRVACTHPACFYTATPAVCLQAKYVYIVLDSANNLIAVSCSQAQQQQDMCTRMLIMAKHLDILLQSRRVVIAVFVYLYFNLRMNVCMYDVSACVSSATNRQSAYGCSAIIPVRRHHPHLPDMQELTPYMPVPEALPSTGTTNVAMPSSFMRK